MIDSIDDLITGIPNSAAYFSASTASNAAASPTLAGVFEQYLSATRIHITRLTTSAPDGYPVEYCCPHCRRHTFVHHPYLCRPTDGDYFRISFCPDYDEHNWEWTKIAGQDVQVGDMDWAVKRGTE